MINPLAIHVLISTLTKDDPAASVFALMGMLSGFLKSEDTTSAVANFISQDDGGMERVMECHGMLGKAIAQGASGKPFND